MKRIALVGAGIAGLVCAQKLASRFDVHLLEKSAKVGGRMASRRVPIHQLNFDHGAQYFTIRSPEGGQLLEDWIDDGVVAPWRGKVVVLRPGHPPETEPTERFVAVPEMNSLADYLAQGLHVETSTCVVAVERADRTWRLQLESGQRSEAYDGLIIATPPAQSPTLPGDVGPLADRFARPQLDPCWATLVHFADPIAVGYDAAFVHENPLRWICRNNSKPGREASQECWVLHASSAWTAEHLGDSPQQVASQLLEQFTEATGHTPGEVRYLGAYLWRHSIPVNPLAESFLWDDHQQLGMCGDWCGGPRVEGAIQSGLALASHLLKQVAS